MAEICMGVLGWSPHQFWFESTYADVCMAIDGLASFHGVEQETPSDKYPTLQTMDELMRQHPDGN